MMWNDLLHEFINNAMLPFGKLRLFVAQLVDILNTLFKYWVSYRQLSFITEMFEPFDLLFANI